MQQNTMKEPQLKLPEAMRLKLVEAEKREAVMREASKARSPRKPNGATANGTQQSSIEQESEVVAAVVTPPDGVNGQQQDAVPDKVAVQGDPAPVVETPPVVEQPVTPEPVAAVEQSVAPQVEPPREAPPAKGEDRWNDPEYCKARVKTMEGFVKVAQADLRKLQVRYESDVAALQAEIAALQSKVPEPEIDLTLYYTPEQIEEHGEDMLRAHLKASRDISRKEVEPVRNQAKQAKQPDRNAEVVESQVNLHKQMIFDAMDDAIPNWREIDSSPQFQVWLSKRDKLSGEVRGELVKRHYEARNTESLVNIMQAYIDEQAPTTPAVETPKPRPTPNTPPKGATGAASNNVIRQQSAEPPLTMDYIREMSKKISTTINPTKAQEAEFERFYQRLQQRGR